MPDLHSREACAATPAIQPAIAGTRTRPSERLVSLDGFRGLVIALMVIVNNPGSNAIFYQFKHAEWNGWTVADTIFPSFLWIVGVATTLSLDKRLAAGVLRSVLLRQALRRAVVLYVLGLVIYVAPQFSFSTQRLLGVLQRIAICYLASVAIYLNTRLRGQVLWIAGLLGAYWVMMALIPVPGFGAGNLTIEGNFAHYVDRVVLGGHNYQRTRTWDPEGIVSTLAALATTLFGVLAGRILRLQKSMAERSVWLVLIGIGLMLLGLVWNIWLPINKHLWTSSFAVLMAGIDYVVFAVFAWLVDGCGYRRWVKPMTIMGMNAIAIYLISELLAEWLSMAHVRTGDSVRSLQEWIYATMFLPFGPRSRSSVPICDCLHGPDVRICARAISETMVPARVGL
jgi:predicted acyltransferase